MRVMIGKTHSILARHRANPAQPCLLSDFTLSDGQPVNKSPFDGMCGWDGYGWSLYCLDFVQNVAVFVRSVNGLNLRATPFVYQAQFEQADQALVMPMAMFLRIGNDLPAPRRLTFLYSTGRCGSTLASRIFAELPGVVSLSEPEGVISAAHQSRHVIGAHHPYIRAAVRFLCHTPGGNTAPHVVIKPRPVSILYDGDFARACPDAHFAFLYRDCQAYVRSMFRFGQRLGLNWDSPGPLDKWLPHWRQMSGGQPIDVLQRYVDTNRADITWAEIGTALWAVTVSAFHGMDESGRRTSAIHYDDLNREKLRGTERLLAACGLNPAKATAGIHAFSRDSHRGGKGANAIPSREMNARETQRMNAVIARMGVPDYAEARI